jgi:hypothetical protein
MLDKICIYKRASWFHINARKKCEALTVVKQNEARSKIAPHLPTARLGDVSRRHFDEAMRGTWGKYLKAKSLDFSA